MRQNTIHKQRATYALKCMEKELDKLREDISFKEFIGFERCMNIFKEHFEDMIRKEREYKLKQGGNNE
jgi:hypothetical protein